jgi:hypothetical protein
VVALFRVERVAETLSARSRTHCEPGYLDGGDGIEQLLKLRVIQVLERRRKTAGSVTRAGGAPEGCGPDAKSNKKHAA